MKQILTIGGIIGIINIILGLIIKYTIGPSILLKGSYMAFSFIFAIVLLVVLGRKYLRTEDFPSLNYGDALKHLFPAGLLAGIIATIFATVLYQNDTEMKQAFQELGVKAAQAGVEFAAKIGGEDEAQIELLKEEAAQEILSKGDSGYPFKFSNLPSNIFNLLISSLINALIASIFVRYKNVKA